MNLMRFETLALALPQRSLERRGLIQSLAGLVGLTGLALLGLDDAEAKKRKKKRKKRRKGGNDGGRAGGGGGAGNECPRTICNGLCVDLDTDPNNCGACGDTCGGGAACVEGRCVLAIGERGDGNFEFDAPRGLAFDNGDLPQMADANNRRVVKFSDDDLFEEFGESGEGDGQFLRPSGVAVNFGTGDIYVTDVERHCIQRFSSSGTFEATFGFFGGGRQQLNIPNAVTIDQVSGNVYITDTGNSLIKELNANLFALGEIRLIGGPGQLANPEGIASDGNRNLVIADTGNNRILITDRDGNFIREIGGTGAGNGQFNRPVAVAVSRAGIFVVDQGNNRVQQFSADGQFLATFGRPGTGPGEFNAPLGISIAGDVIGVVDTGNNRVQFFFPAGVATESLQVLSGHGGRSRRGAAAGKGTARTAGAQHGSKKRTKAPSHR